MMSYKNKQTSADTERRTCYVNSASILCLLPFHLLPNWKVRKRKFHSPVPGSVEYFTFCMLHVSEWFCLGPSCAGSWGGGPSAYPSLGFGANAGMVSLIRPSSHSP